MCAGREWWGGAQGRTSAPVEETAAGAQEGGVC